MKRCTKCQEVKSAESFRKRASAKDGLRYECRDCQDEYNRGHQEANRERKAQYDRGRYLSNREQVAEERKAYREANHEKVRRYQRKRRKANPTYMKEWRKANRERVNAAVRKRRAQQLGVPSEPYSLQEVWDKTSGVCGICGLTITASQTAQIDHIVPLSRGGHDTLANVQIAHTPCNRAKWAHGMDADSA